MLMEAAVHYYQTTGKTTLLNVAVKLSNYICKQMGPSPRYNVIPGHGGSEEALLKLYWLLKKEPALKQRMSVPVQEDQYYGMVRFWIENRGNYGKKDGSHARKSDGAYNQDHMPVLEQKTIEGHAVRATLLATGVAAMALENREPAYLETCAAIGAAFFSQRMNELLAGGKYMDEFERVIYNNLLSGVSQSGDHYFYENPLIANDHKRWAWHSCPCCPPMFLKLVSALPGFIYASDTAGVYVNLFIGSEYKASVGNKGNIALRQLTQYPWKGESQIVVDPGNESEFTVSVRIPGWAQSIENHLGLYYSKVMQPASLQVNGERIALKPLGGDMFPLNGAGKKEMSSA